MKHLRCHRWSSFLVVVLSLGAVSFSTAIALGKTTVVEGEFLPKLPKGQHCLPPADGRAAGQIVYWAPKRSAVQQASFLRGPMGSLIYSSVKVDEYGDYDVFEEKIRWRRTKGRRLTCVLETKSIYNWGDVNPEKRLRLTLDPPGGRARSGTWTHNRCHVKVRNTATTPDYSILRGCWAMVEFYLPKTS